MADWKQVEDLLMMTKMGMTVNFLMPEDFCLEKVHKDTLKLCEWLMFSPWDKEILKDYEWTRKPTGEKIALAYSGGVDSTAALTLMDFLPDLYLFYMQRQGIDDSCMRQANPLKSIKMVEEIRQQGVMRIKTDFEKIRHFLENKMPGFSTDLCILIGGLLMADQYGIKYLACGQMLESTWLAHGYEYRDFKESGYWKRHTEIFEKAGFELFFPVHACSEVLTSKIAESGRYYGIGNACIRSNLGGRGCMNCYKCFRKQMIAGKLIPVNPDAESKLKEDKIKQGCSLIHAYNKHKFYIYQLEKYKGLDYSWLEDYYAPALECIPIKFRKYVEEQLDKYSKPMEYDLSKFEWGKE